MKKWFVILSLALLLTGCGKKQESDVKDESPKQTSVEGVEEATEKSEASESSKETIAQTEEGAESVEESKESAEETTESIEENTEPVVESTEAIESEPSDEAMEFEESSEDTESPEEAEEEDVEEEEYPVWQPEDLFPNSSEEEIPDELLEGLSADSLSYARYMIFGRNGLDYSDENKLNPVEKLNIEKIKAVEAKVRLEAPVPTTDLVYLECWAYGDWLDIVYAYISDGDMYYYCDKTGYFSTDFYMGQIQKYTGLTNIKRIKTFNCGTSVEKYPCLITEEGEVYWVYADRWSEEAEIITLTKFALLEGYQVEDILLYSGERQHQVEVLLKDGSIIYLESERWD